MTDSVTGLLLATAFFVGIHLFVSGTSLRTVFVGMMGEKVYQGLFSVASLIGLVWMIMAYKGAYILSDYTVLWDGSGPIRHIGMLFIALGILISLPGILTPTVTGATADMMSADKAYEVKGMTSITRHPMLAGFGLWALGHLLINGDIASIVLFGGILLLCITGMIAIDKKRAAKDPENWAAFVAKTSRIPLLAVITGRTRLDVLGVGWRWAVGVVAIGLLMKFHEVFTGVALF